MTRHSLPKSPADLKASATSSKASKAPWCYHGLTGHIAGFVGVFGHEVDEAFDFFSPITICIHIDCMCMS